MARPLLTIVYYPCVLDWTMDMFATHDFPDEMARQKCWFFCNGRTLPVYWLDARVSLFSCALIAGLGIPVDSGRSLKKEDYKLSDPMISSSDEIKLLLC